MNDTLLNEILQFGDFGPKTKKRVGFFEINEKLTKKNIDKTISFLINTIKSDLNNYIVAVSCFLDKNKKLASDNDYKIYKDVIRSENELITLGVLYEIDFTTYFNYADNDDFDNQQSELCETFRYYTSNSKLIKQLSLICLCESNVAFNDGYCFFISIKNNVIIYPHGDNSGYGFYLINKTEKSIAFDILEKASKIDFLNTKFP